MEANKLAVELVRKSSTGRWFICNQDNTKQMLKRSQPRLLNERDTIRFTKKCGHKVNSIVVVNGINYFFWCDGNIEDMLNAKIYTFNIVIEQEQVEVKVEEFTQPTETADGKHYQHEVIKTCVKQDLPVYLYGPAGSGKNFTLQLIAEELGLEFYFTNSVQQEFKITGFIDAGGIYHETEFYKAFTKGGLFFLDEMDASIPEVLVLLNAAIANRYFEFPTGKVYAHKDFRVVAAGNTIGSGANDLYTGRLVLDQATLDRFITIEFNYDRNVELKLAKGDVGLVSFIDNLRAQATTKGIRATFSYRCIISVIALKAAGMNIKLILQIAVFKGMDRDTLRTFTPTGTGTYSSALKELVA